MLSALIPSVLGISVFTKRDLLIRTLILFILCSLLLQIATFSLYLLNINNLPLFHVYTYFEFFAISVIYYFAFQTFKIRRYILIILSFGFTFFSFYSLVKWEYFYTFNSVQRFTEFLFILTYILLFFTTLLRKGQTGAIENQPVVILSFGLLIYFLGTLLLFVNASNFMSLGIKNPWILHSILNIFINVIYFIVIWKSNKHTIH